MADLDYNESESEIEPGKKQRKSQAGRKLMRWNPDVDQFVLLAVDTVCNELGTPVPWEYVAQKINYFVTGESIKQHLAKVRKYREENGRPVPEKASRIGGRKADTGDDQAPRTSKKKVKRDLDLGDAPLPDKGASLLWTDRRNAPPRPPVKSTVEAGQNKVKKPKSGKKNVFEQTPPAGWAPKTPAKKSDQSGMKHEDQEASGVRKPTGKRSRGKKEPVIKDEVDSEYESPSKRQRHLRRATTPVNYRVQDLDEFSDDVFDARNADDHESDGDYDDAIYSSQQNTGLKSKGASSYSPRKNTGPSTSKQAPPPPNFEGMMHARTGKHSYDREYAGQESHFGGVFTGLNNSYGPGASGSNGKGGRSGEVPGYDQSHHSGSQQIPRGQPQMQTQNAGGGGPGRAKQAREDHDDGAPARKARKQGSRNDDDSAPVAPSSKKNKKKANEAAAAKQAKKDKTSHKARKDSVMEENCFAGQPQEEEQTTYHSHNTFGEIPAMSDTGRGNTQGFDMPPPVPNMVYSQTPLDPQQTPALTPSPTDMNYNFQGGFGGLPNPSSVYSGQDLMSTGITPNFNNFSFGDNNLAGSPNFDMSGTDYNGGGGGVNLGDFDFGSSPNMINFTNTTNSSFSSSNGTSAAGSQGDQAFPGMVFGGDSTAGLGMNSTWMPEGFGLGMGMDMSGGVDPDHDVFSFVNQEAFQ